LAEIVVQAVRHAAQSMPWEDARRAAGEAAAPLPVLSRPLAHAAGHALAASLTALTDLPAEPAPAGYRGSRTPGGAHLPGGSRRWLVGLPGNPLAAIAGLVTLAQPLLRRLGGHPRPVTRTLVVEEAIAGHPPDARLLPALAEDTRAVPLPFDGPAMLRGAAAADVLLVVPPAGVPAGGRAAVLPLTPGR
jgi:molybdopterin biosynthesis enzyme